MRKENLYKMLLAAMFLSIGLILPLFTSQIKEIGDSLLPMHFTVMLCGLICSKWLGLAVGLLTPLLRGIIFGMPPLFPNGMWMALELATYGFIIGLLYNLSKKKPFWYIYICLISSMIVGRIVWGISKAVLLGLGENGFTIGAFITGGFVDAFPGILIQLILIPVIVATLKKPLKHLEI